MQQSLDYRSFSKIALAAILILGVPTYWNRKLQRLNRELERLSITDRLTGLYNRMRLDECFDREIRRCQRHPQACSASSCSTSITSS